MSPRPFQANPLPRSTAAPRRVATPAIMKAGGLLFVISATVITGLDGILFLRYEAILRQQHRRREENRAKSKADLKARERLFSFYEVDKLRARRKEEAERKDQEEADKKRSHSPAFRANDVPPSTREVAPYLMCLRQITVGRRDWLFVARERGRATEVLAFGMKGTAALNLLP